MWSFWRWIDKCQGENCCSTFPWSELCALISCRWNPDEKITTFLPIDELVDHQSAIIDFSFYCSDSVEKPFRLLIIPIVPAGEDSEIAGRFGFVCSLFQRSAKSGIESSSIPNGRTGILFYAPEATAHPFRKNLSRRIIIEEFFFFIYHHGCLFSCVGCTFFVIYIPQTVQENDSGQISRCWNLWRSCFGRSAFWSGKLTLSISPKNFLCNLFVLKFRLPFVWPIRISFMKLPFLQEWAHRTEDMTKDIEQFDVLRFLINWESLQTSTLSTNLSVIKTIVSIGESQVKEVSDSTRKIVIKRGGSKMRRILN